MESYTAIIYESLYTSPGGCDRSDAIAPTAASDPSQTCQPDYRHAATVTHGCRG